MQVNIHRRRLAQEFQALESEDNAIHDALHDVNQRYMQLLERKKALTARVGQVKQAMAGAACLQARLRLPP